MKIWQLCFNVNNYANLQAFPPLTADDIQSFNGSKKLAGWTPLRIADVSERGIGRMKKAFLKE